MQAGERIAIWIDKNAIDSIDPKWLHQEPQKYYPLVIVGYKEPLYSFREKITGFGIKGPYVDWSKLKLNGGYSIWMLIEATNTTTKAFLKGYDMPLNVEDILIKSKFLLENKIVEERI